MNPYNQQQPPYGQQQQQPYGQQGYSNMQQGYSSPQPGYGQQNYGIPPGQQAQQGFPGSGFSSNQPGYSSPLPGYSSPQQQPYGQGYIGQQFGGQGPTQFGQQQPYGQPPQQFGQSQNWMSQSFTGGYNPQLQQTFEMWDKNHDGEIEPHELQKAMHHLGEPVNDEDVQKIMNMFDKDHSGTINFNEFGQLYNYVTELKQEFQNADVHHNGLLDVEQVKQALHRHHKALLLAGGAATVYTLFKLHDRHKREKLDWNQFLGLSLHMGSLRSQFENQFGGSQQYGTPQYGTQTQPSPYGQPHHKMFDQFTNWASNMIESHIRR